MSTSNLHTFNLTTTLFEPWNVVLPEDNTGIVYLLLSTKSTKAFHIGESINLHESLREYSCGRGTEATRPIKRRPWAVLAFATGFDTQKRLNEHQRKELESSINYRAERIGPNVTSNAVFELFRECVERFAVAYGLELNVVQCGKII